MTAKSKSRGLGRGLSALMTDQSAQDDETAAAARQAGPVRTVSIGMLSPNPFQPRVYFDESAIEELAASMREKGVLQPLLVRPAPGGGRGYQIIAGERRWRAAQRAGVHDVPVVVREMDDRSALELAIIENVQRQELTAVEEARSYKRLIDEFGHNQEAVGRIVGKSRSHVANLMRLLSLPEAVLRRVEAGGLSMGHARALVGADNADALAERIEQEGLTVRQVERMIADAKAPPAEADAAAAADNGADGADRPKRRGKAAAKDADTRALEDDLADALGLSVTITHGGERGGTLTVSYKTLEQLDDVCGRLMTARGGTF
ncbi:ParB/RepB/Spo0J family partition protein [Rhodothalassium salexigens]|uniref:ParB/RepB/Spo0J family partition protein n=1 Tax=Rhodothalassium salexigens TaxID=1086 RepID=UPI001912D8EA